MGPCDNGDHPATLAQTRCPRSRVHGAHQDFTALIVPGGTGTQAQFDLIGLRASKPTVCPSFTPYCIT